MPITLAIEYLAKQSIQALPSSIRVDIPNTPASCNDLYSCRTMWGIVSTCLVTVFTCTWVAIDPNIPGPDESSLAITARHFQEMAMALIAPELVIIWAMRQWFVSRRLAAEHTKQKWVQVHGFFALMGGFMLFNGDQALHVLYPEDLEPLSRTGQIDFPNVTEAEINDKSKDDLLSKGIVVIQTGWFILQCIARGTERLPITELEIVTLAFAALNFVTYGLWWKKPMNVGCAIPVRWKPISHRGRVVPARVAEVEAEAVDLGRGEGENDVFARIVIRHQEEEALGTGGPIWQRVWRVFKLGIWKPIAPFYEMGFADSPMKFGAKRVPTFYAGKLTESEAWSAHLAAAVVAVIFGGIHLIAWSNQFPSLQERALWRISSIAITCLPALMLLVAAKVPSASWAYVIIVICSVLYILARVALLIMPFTSLRSPPPDTYRTVVWTNMIPHI